MPLYTLVLSTEQFGTADILTQTANLIIPLAALGIADGLFRFALDAEGEKRKEVFTTALSVVLIGILPLAAIIQLLRFVDIYDGYIWLILFVGAYAMRKLKNPLWFAMLGGVFGMAFGLLCSPVYMAIGGFSYGIRWWLAGLVFDVPHAIGNAVIAALLFAPMRKLLKKLYH
jgi:hypothetical protein